MREESVAKFGDLTQAQFEDLVRQAWAIAGQGWCRLHPQELARAVAIIVLAVDAQPKLLEGRAIHNLGHTKAEWLRDLMEQKP